MTSWRSRKSKILMLALGLMISWVTHAGWVEDLSIDYEHMLYDLLQSGQGQFKHNQPRDAFGYDCTPGAWATPSERQAIVHAQRVLQHMAVKRVFRHQLHDYLIVVVLDGTGKNAENLLAMNGEQLTDDLISLVKPHHECLLDSEEGVQAEVPSKLYKGVPPQFPSNPALLAWLIQRAGRRHVNVIYVPGVGADSQATYEQNEQNAVTGDTLMRQVDEGYRRSWNVLAEIRQRDPLASFMFITVGFSRGAAAARILNNVMIDHGFPDLVVPENIRLGASLLYDTVITQRIDIEQATAIDSPQSFAQQVNAQAYRISPLVTQVLHITAQNEYREGFELRPAIGKQVKQISLPGAHSDIGGGYGFDGISAVTLQMGMDYLSRAGVPMGTLPDAFRPNPADEVIHDSRSLPWLPFNEQLNLPRRLNTR